MAIQIIKVSHESQDKSDAQVANDLESLMVYLWPGLMSCDRHGCLDQLHNYCGPSLISHLSDQSDEDIASFLVAVVCRNHDFGIDEDDENAHLMDVLDDIDFERDGFGILAKIV